MPSRSSSLKLMLNVPSTRISLCADEQMHSDMRARIQNPTAPSVKYLVVFKAFRRCKSCASTMERNESQRRDMPRHMRRMHPSSCPAQRLSLASSSGDGALLVKI